MTLKKVERAITGLTVILGILIILGFLIFVIAELAEVKLFEDRDIATRVWPYMIGMFAVSVALTFALNIAVLSRYFRRFVEAYLERSEGRDEQDG